MKTPLALSRLPKSLLTGLACAGTLLGFSLFAATAATQTATFTIDAGKPGAAISPILYGLMTEEINHSYDGGLYAELIQNRAFKDNASDPVHWSLVQGTGAEGAIALDKSNPVNTTALTTSLRLDIKTASAGKSVGIANDGYWGIPVKPGTHYAVSFYARAAAGFSGPLTVAIESNDGATVYAKADVTGISADWKQYTAKLATDASAKPSTENRFVVSASSPGTVWLSLVSLFPPTYKDRANGNRVDLMQMLAGMQPGFLRFPGGNYFEGDTIEEHFDWKKTIHGPDQRPGHRQRWNYQLHRRHGPAGIFELVRRS